MINSISVGYGSMSGAPVVAVDDELNAEGALVVTCFPSAGFVSSIVAHYLVDRLGLTFVGGAIGAGLPPVCLVQEGKPLPPLRFYAGEPICHMDRCDKVVLIASEIQVNADLTLSLADSILDWVEASGASQVMMIDSFSHGPDQHILSLMMMNLTNRCWELVLQIQRKKHLSNSAFQNSNMVSLEV